MDQQKLNRRLKALKIIIDVLSVAATTLSNVLEANQRPVKRVKGKTLPTKKKLPPKRKMASLRKMERDAKRALAEAKKLEKEEVKNGVSGPQTEK